MDEDSKGTGDRRRLSTLFTRLKPKARGPPKAVPAPSTAAAPARATLVSIPTSSTATLRETSATAATQLDHSDAPTPQAAIPSSTSTTILASILNFPTVTQTAIPETQLVPSGDRERTEKRYCEAVEQLHKSVKLPRKNWEAFEIPDFKNLADVINPIPQLQEDIKKTLDARAGSFKDPGFWSTSKRVAERIFTAITPFAINFLSVANEGSAVWSIEETVH
jgi:hypothetical protein